MTQYIDKDAVVAEMKRRIFNLEQLGDRNFIETHFTEQFRFIEIYEGIIDFINTLEVKEVNLEEEICSFFSKNPIPYEHITDWPLLKNCAIHFFELGLKAQKGE